MCGAFGIGGGDERALTRCYDHLEPGGVLVTDIYLPYAESPDRWAVWTPEKRQELPRSWPEQGDRKKTSDGDEIELRFRLVDISPLEQYEIMQMRALLWRDGRLVQREEQEIRVNLYFKNEILLMLKEVGFSDVEVYRAFDWGQPDPDSEVLGFVARRAD